MYSLSKLPAFCGDPLDTSLWNPWLSASVSRSPDEHCLQRQTETSDFTRHQRERAHMHTGTKMPVSQHKDMDNRLLSQSCIREQNMVATELPLPGSTTAFHFHYGIRVCQQFTLPRTKWPPFPWKCAQTVQEEQLYSCPQGLRSGMQSCVPLIPLLVDGLPGHRTHKEANKTKAQYLHSHLVDVLEGQAEG